MTSYEFEFGMINKIATSDLSKAEKDKMVTEMIQDEIAREKKFEKYRRVIDAMNRGDTEYIKFISENLYLLD
jgi:hypothetical protein